MLIPYPEAEQIFEINFASIFAEQLANAGKIGQFSSGAISSSSSSSGSFELFFPSSFFVSLSSGVLESVVCSLSPEPSSSTVTAFFFAA